MGPKDFLRKPARKPQPRSMRDRWKHHLALANTMAEADFDYMEAWAEGNPSRPMVIMSSAFLDGMLTLAGFCAEQQGFEIIYSNDPDVLSRPWD